MPFDYKINRLNAGELSPYMEGPTDLEKYYSGCRTLENMLVLPYGGVIRMPGTYFVSEVKDHSKKVRCVKFQFSVIQAYNLEFGDQYIRFYKDHGQIITEDACSGNMGTPSVSASVRGGDEVRLFDDNLIDPYFWEMNTNFPYWGQYEFSTAKTIVKYTLSAGPYVSDRMPKDWTFLASNTGAFGGEEVTLDTVTNETAWDANEKRTFTFANVTAYKYYRINITAGNHATVLRIYDMEMMESTDGSVTYPYEIDSPYLEADLFGLYFCRSADVMYINHIDHTYPTYKLSRYNHTSWTLKKVDFKGGPFLPRNNLEPATDINEITIACSYPIWVVSIDYVRDNHTYSGDKTLDAIAVVDLGQGLVKIKSTAHGFSAGDQARFDDTTNYDGCHAVLAGSDADWLVIRAKYVAETPDATDKVKKLYKCIKDHTSGAGDEPGVGGSWTTYWEATQYLKGNNLELQTSSFDWTNNPQIVEIFKEAHVGALWQIIHNLAESLLDDNFSSVTQSRAILTKGTWNFVTHGDWIGKMQLQRSYDSGDTWNPYHTFTKRLGGDNIKATDIEEEDNVLYRVAMIERASGSCEWCFSLDDPTIKGVVKINSYVDSRNVTAEVQTALGDMSATKRWAEGMYSDERGYPSCATFIESRLALGGSTHRPQTLCLSKSNEFENMRAGTLDDDAIVRTLGSTEVNALRWMVAKDVLLMGTAGGEWKFGSPDPETPITPGANMQAKRQTTYGSAKIQALLLANAVLFVQGDKKKVRGFRYYFEKGEAGGYDAKDMTILAEHITGDGIVWMDYQQRPDSVLWCGRTDGQLIGMAFEPSENVIGWFRIITDGEIESGAVIPIEGGEDEIWISVKRGTKRYIEYFKPRKWGSDQADCFFVHSGLTFDGGAAVTITSVTKAAQAVVAAAAHGFSDGDHIIIKDAGGMTELNNIIYTIADKTTDAFKLKDRDNEVYIDSSGFTTYTSGGTAQQVKNTFTNLSHLEGKEVCALVDGATCPNVTVSSNQVTLSRYGNKVHIGLPYKYRGKPMRIELPLQSGSVQGRTKRITKGTIRFKDTLGCKFGSDENHLTTIPFRKMTDPLGVPPPLFTGDKEVTWEEGYEKAGDIYFEGDLPLPCSVLSIIVDVEVY